MECIAKQENIKIDNAAEDAIVEISGGDCRRVENILQSCAAISDKITEDVVFSLASMAKPKELLRVLNLAVSGKFVDARNELLSVMLNYGLSGADAIRQIQREILALDIDNKKKMILIDRCGEAEFRISEGSDAFIQLEAFLANAGLIGQN